MRKFLISAAAIALAATGAHAEPGKGNGNGGNKGGKPEMSMKANGNGGGKQDRGPAMREAKSDRGQAMKPAKVDRGPEYRADRKVERGNDVRVDNRTYDRREDRDYRRDGYRDVRTVSFEPGSRAYFDGCPPGLAKKNNGCMPPGQAKKQGDWSDGFYRPSYFGYGSLGDGRYRYGDGYLYRISDRGSVLGYIPLLGGALSVGNEWPSYYQPVSVPQYYVDYYNLGPANGYRYADDVLYRVDPETAAITSVAALLTGDEFVVGQPMPTGYDVYNVPYQYRDRYYDSPDAYYRYSDGYVYQVDPTTQLVAAAIQLLT
ncbi:hypothetical protein A6F68_01469 [Tsuneonella dongtanensis]|uniref:Uncharacterized protein n=1 Tax=Tsuneonella dongtanensis TaxID=692370 RepID=A0A1B2AD56_9SPHN|nr:hypothetical protein [Tsuneonella dongtanensis]ANY19985.1 hypothetical protein A6F68_01469 [Tsuneonella dongtanensis]